MRRGIGNGGVLVISVIALIVVWLATGGRVDIEPLPAPDRPVMSGVRDAKPYTALRTGDLWDNSARSQDLQALQIPTTTPEQSKEEALALRASRRAYAGAPPVVPHPINQRDPAVCMGCHGQGLQVEHRFASKISHPYLTSCVQCHVEGVDHGHPDLQATGLLAANLFAGRTEPSEGPRWTSIAPPQIPHQVHMREDCLSCHGPKGQPALRTSHPERQNCLQCHTEAAAASWQGRTDFPPPVLGADGNGQ